MTDHYVLTQIISLITGRPKSLVIVKPVVTTSKSRQISEQKIFQILNSSYNLSLSAFLTAK